MQKSMTLKQYLHYASDVLKAKNIETPVTEAGVMLCHVLNCNKVYLYSHDDRLLEDHELEKLNNMLMKRVENVPLQYLIGKTEFMSLSFIVDQHVLIPRQDTEILVEKCIEIIDSKLIKRPEYQDIKFLDMCTGSGCIAVSIAHYYPEIKVVACDISEDALKVAEANISRNEVQESVTLYRGDLFNALNGETGFDFIVSNPPYIETGVISELQAQVKDHEPYLALDGGQDGLEFYRRIIAEAPKYLNDNGVLAFEIGYNQAESVSSLMETKFQNIRVYKDFGGNDRVIIGQIAK